MTVGHPAFVVRVSTAGVKVSTTVASAEIVKVPLAFKTNVDAAATCPNGVIVIAVTLAKLKPVTTTAVVTPLRIVVGVKAVMVGVGPQPLAVGQQGLIGTGQQGFTGSGQQTGGDG